MDTCLLRPPTRKVLSDDIISGAAQRPRGFRSYAHVEQPSRPTYPTEHVAMGYPHPTHAYYTTPEHNSAEGPMDRKRKRQESTDSTLMLLAVSSGAAEGGPGTSNNQHVSTEWLMAQQEHQREIRRLRQIRYRKKKENYANTLEEETHQLRQEIDKLEQRRRSVSAAVPSEKTLWNVAVEYFRLFRYGLRASDLSEQAANSSEPQPCAQLDFLRAAMAPDVMYNAGRGIDSIMTNWKYLSLWFQDVEVELDGLKKCGVDALIAKTTTKLTINKRALVTVFPHLCSKDSGAAGLELVKKLYGKTITMRGSTRFEWDSGYGRVTSVISESDMLTPMLRLLGSLEGVSRVFEKSLISLAPYRSQNTAARQGVGRQ
uniref:BZIP domain-containing protein n=1 Tax=Phytophthora ramorum TaxID=164328 RepID=H3GHJ5_PHYRM